MSRPIGSKNKEKKVETLYTFKCSKCKFVLKTCIPMENVSVGHICKNYS